MGRTLRADQNPFEPIADNNLPPPQCSTSTKSVNGENFFSESLCSQPVTATFRAPHKSERPTPVLNARAWAAQTEFAIPRVAALCLPAAPTAQEAEARQCDHAERRRLRHQRRRAAGFDGGHEGRDVRLAELRLTLREQRIRGRGTQRRAVLREEGPVDQAVVRPVDRPAVVEVAVEPALQRTVAEEPGVD